MAPQAQVEDRKLAEHKDQGLKASDEAPKTGKPGPRKRVSQACDRCRSRKDKCDGKKPACSTCITGGRSCSYDANVKKRGLPEGYVRGLEKLWGIAIKEVDTIEDSILTALAGTEDGNESALNVWNDENNSETWVEAWRKSQMSRELERLLSSQEPSTETMKRKRMDSDVQSTKRLGTTAAYENGGQWQEISVGKISQTDFQRPPSPARVSAIDDFLGKEYESILSPSTAHGAVSSGTPAAASIDLPELPSETWHLLDVYFSYTHSWLPIIEKHDLLRTSYQYSQNRNAAASSSGSGENAVLWAAIAYAKFQHRAINNIPRALGNVGEMVWTAERMYSQARALIPNEEGNLELGHVQALLILTLANMGIGQYSRAWSLIGQAVRAAVDLHLDRPMDLVSNSTKARSRSKHVFLGCFVLDTLVAARLKRRPHLRTDDIDAVGLVEEDGLEEWDPWTDCLTVRRGSSGNSRVPASILSTFNRLIQVLKLLNDATCVPADVNCMQASTTLLEKLETWSQSQPGSFLDLLSSNGAQSSFLLPHQNHLYNIYFTTLAASQLLSRGNEYEAVDLEPCTRSAKHVVGLINQHSNNFGLLIVPPTYEYFVKTAYDVVHAVQSSIESTHIVLNDWKRSLDHCLDTMGPAWPVFESFKTSITYQSASEARRQSQVAFDLISGISQDTDTPMSGGKTPQSMASYETLSSHSPQIFRTMARPETVQQPRNTMQSFKTQAPRSSSFGQSSGHGLPQNPLNIYENAHAPYLQNKRPSTSATDKSSAPVASLQAQEFFKIAAPNNPQLHRSLTMSSADVEFDPMFNELMRLDATEWSGNWDQSLMDLGFTESDNMNQDFYAFCQEPDPLHQNNVFQQLVANTNAETTDFFDASGNIFGGMTMTSGFGAVGMGVAVGDENEGIEASQILQALSAAEEQRTIGRAG